MVNNILIISSEYTGLGHKSIAEALESEIKKRENINLHIVDGFKLGHKGFTMLGKSYGTITKVSPKLWKSISDTAEKRPEIMDKIAQLHIEKKLLKVLSDVKPDAILTVHPDFNGSVLNILRKHHIKIPFATFIADLVCIHTLWADPRADLVICPTEEAKRKCIAYGVEERKIKVTGFPVRERFLKDRGNDLHNKNEGDSLRFLVMSGGEGVGNMSVISKELLDNFDCQVDIIAGRNYRMKKRLQNTLYKGYGERVKVHGFVNNVEDLMAAADVLVTRGSPNSMMEAVACNTPMVITGTLIVQEEKNPEYAEKNNLAVVSMDVTKIRETVEQLLADERKRLEQIRKSQREFYDSKVAEKIVHLLLNITKQ